MATEDRSRKSTKKAVLGRSIRIVGTLATLALAARLVVPHLHEMKASAALLAGSAWFALAAMFGCQLISNLAYGELVHTVLRSAEQSAPRHLVQRAMVAGTCVQRTVPWGSGVSLAVIVGALRRGGLDAPRATASVIASGMLSSFVLALFLPVTAIVAVLLGAGGGMVAGVIAVAAVVIATALVARIASKRPALLGAFIEKIFRPASRGPLKKVIKPQAFAAAVVKAVSGVDQLVSDRRALGRAFFWALLNWAADLGVLIAVSVALAPGISLPGLALAFVIGQLVAAVPITPGGVGIVEATVTAALIAQGAPPAAATVTVLGWRLISHWLPIMVGAVILPTLGIGQRRNVAAFPVEAADVQKAA
ncbi:MAG: YbhN family protein [Actinomycetota bacterium]|nr:YbhN family protein [Actinomycetota bacterium]